MTGVMAVAPADHFPQWRRTEPFGASMASIMRLEPVVPRAEYDVIRLMHESVPGDIDAICARSRAAYVGQAVSRPTARVDMSR